MNVFGGLKREDWERWGQFTTFKSNAVALLKQSLRSEQRIYCSPLVDPYQPAEAVRELMPDLLRTLETQPPAVFTVQTRGPLIERDIRLLQRLRQVTRVRISFSISTDSDRIRGLYEPHCEPIEQRLATIHRLREAGIEVFATLAPLLPCNPEALAELAMDVTDTDLIGDPFHVRSVKKSGATTRWQAFKIAEHQDHTEWFDPQFQNTIVERIRRAAGTRGRKFATGPEGFAWLAKT
jgi:DNA repair photolyase